MIKCAKCRNEKDDVEFVRGNSVFLPNGRSYLCLECLEKMVDVDNLDEMDGLMRWLDVPFDVNLLMNVRRGSKNGRRGVLRAYFNELYDSKYDGGGWKEENERWKRIREEKREDEEIEAFKEDREKKLHERWSAGYSWEELLWLDDYYEHIKATQNVSTPILEEYAKDLCEIELQIKKGLRSGEDVKKLMDARNDTIKIANFTANNSKTASAFESIGELMVYYGKKGFKVNYHQEPKDSIDFLMKNDQNYLRRVVMNEGSLGEMVEEKKEAYNLSARLEESERDYDVQTAVSAEYEDDGIGIEEEDVGGI